MKLSSMQHLTEELQRLETKCIKIMKQFLVILSIVCLGLGVGLVLRHTRAQEQLASARAQALSVSNQLAEVHVRLTEQEKLASYLQSNLTEKATQLAVATNTLTQVSASLATTQNDMKAAQAELQAKVARVAELEAQNDEATRKLSELAGSINTLEAQIVETRRKLDASEGDRIYLTKETSRLQADKAELLRQFNDLAVLRAQVALLKEEAVINERLALMSKGLYHIAGGKGAQGLMKKATIEQKTNPQLDVEIDQKNGTRVVQPEKR
jgi:predicted RNase H-like nuclease (RuvC/YqgF family)